MNFKKEEINLTTPNEGIKTVGYVLSGLGIHRTLLGWGNHTHFSDNSWTITHLKTGRLLEAYIKGLKYAKEMVRKLVTLTNWEKLTLSAWEKNTSLHTKTKQVLHGSF
jgi:hypothetical protein